MFERVIINVTAPININTMFLTIVLLNNNASLNIKMEIPTANIVANTKNDFNKNTSTFLSNSLKNNSIK